MSAYLFLFFNIPFFEISFLHKNVMTIGHQINKEPLRIKKIISCLSIRMFSIFVSSSVYESSKQQEYTFNDYVFFCIYRELHCQYEPLS